MKLIFFAHFSGFNIFPMDITSSIGNIENLSKNIDFSIIAANNDTIFCSKTFIAQGTYLHFISFYDRVLETGNTPRPSNIGVGLLSQNTINISDSIKQTLFKIKNDFIKEVSINGKKLQSGLSNEELKKIIKNIYSNNYLYIQNITPTSHQIPQPTPLHEYPQKTKLVVDTNKNIPLNTLIDIQQKNFTELYSIDTPLSDEYKTKLNYPEILIGDIKENGDIKVIKEKKQLISLPATFGEKNFATSPHHIPEKIHTTSPLPYTQNPHIQEEEEEEVIDFIYELQTKAKQWKTISIVSITIGAIGLIGGIIIGIGNGDEKKREDSHYKQTDTTSVKKREDKPEKLPTKNTTPIEKIREEEIESKNNNSETIMQISYTTLKNKHRYDIDKYRWKEIYVDITTSNQFSTNEKEHLKILFNKDLQERKENLLSQIEKYKSSNGKEGDYDKIKNAINEEFSEEIGLKKLTQSLPKKHTQEHVVTKIAIEKRKEQRGKEEKRKITEKTAKKDVSSSNNNNIPNNNQQPATSDSK